MQQTNFFTEPKNTRTREYMLTCKLQSDLLNAAGNRGYPLQIYLPTVDRDGFDIIFSDKQTLAPIQLKSTITKRSDWKIHRKFFVLAIKILAHTVFFHQAMKVARAAALY